jgi:DNA-binding NtrC family response regulator
VDSLICESTAMLDVRRRIARAAQVDSPVLIWGERGAGKKLVAEMIHRQSRRGQGPFVIVRPEHADSRELDRQLFGEAEQPGELAAAQGGTLLIDGITDVPRTSQARLLDVVEARDAERRDAEEHPIDFRLMATACNELSASVRQGVVRQDLYYRLTVVTIHVPSLRERREDIPPLVQHMLGELCAVRGKSVPEVTPELMRYFAERSWHGNGGELRACLEAMLEAGDASVWGVNQLPPRSAVQPGRPGQAVLEGRIDTLAEVERTAVTWALQAHQGNRTQAAKSLGISVRTLQRKLRQWGA